MFLRQSNQLHKQMLILSGFDRIYEYGPMWRAEERLTPRHLSEAWCLDVEMVDVKNVRELIMFVGNLLNIVTASLADTGEIRSDDIIDKTMKTFEYHEVVSLLNQEKILYEYGKDFGYEIELKLGEIVKKIYKIDIFAVTHYPSDVKKFYTKSSKGHTETFDIFYKGWEISSGAIRENNYKKLINNIKMSGLDLSKYLFYIDSFKNNSRSHGGFCLGIDRILAKMKDKDNVKEFVLYPRNKEAIIP